MVNCYNGNMITQESISVNPKFAADLRYPDDPKFVSRKLSSHRKTGGISDEMKKGSVKNAFHVFHTPFIIS